MPFFRWRSRRTTTNPPPQPWVSAPPPSVFAQRRYLEDADYPLPKDYPALCD